MAPKYIKDGDIKRTGAITNPAQPNAEVAKIVTGVIDEIRANGDAAVRQYSEKFDKWSPPSFKLSQSQIEECMAAVDPQIIKDIKAVQANVRKFAQAQKDSLKDFEIEMEPGVFLGQRNTPIDAIGT